MPVDKKQVDKVIAAFMRFQELGALAVEKEEVKQGGKTQKPKEPETAKP